MGKTALEITEEEMALYRATARRREKRLRQEQLQYIQRAWKLAEQAAAILKERYRAIRAGIARKTRGGQEGSEGAPLQVRYP